MRHSQPFDQRRSQPEGARFTASLSRSWRALAGDISRTLVARMPSKRMSVAVSRSNTSALDRARAPSLEAAERYATRRDRSLPQGASSVHQSRQRSDPDLDFSDDGRLCAVRAHRDPVETARGHLRGEGGRQHRGRRSALTGKQVEEARARRKAGQRRGSEGFRRQSQTLY